MYQSGRQKNTMGAKHDKAIPIQCVDDADGCPSVIVYDDKTFPTSLQQHVQDAIERPASDDGQGPESPQEEHEEDDEEDDWEHLLSSDINMDDKTDDKRNIRI